MTTAPPTPPDTDPAAFVAALRRLKAWSGLSYRRLERRATEAGHVLPHSTAATMLGRERLPREEPVAAFVAACGLRGAEAEAWTDARRRIACGPEEVPAVCAVRPRRARPRRRAALAMAALSLTALLGGALTSGALTEDEEVRETRTVYDASRDH
ncbi:hypothetical protein ACSCB1_14005 [Streptomyces europaeiscabiei]|uniref:Helix-turn-helix domain-containing protein n=1 Tax=Streptomyces europaeiscabiei TaxID=146819 RepID=A0ABU4NPL6_9ACTN|nr:hypothetical protein [Streptomyces europaeiscabiei]MDX2528807.1 hypothetical protein [Streptomyces europaeiscabiei]MDX2760809.1 hypothetical protein [Streptomyces europaeiscabiei]MDX2771131.1 hypothetical protein [Streptomyces europaeiscabiei]MDX3548055.1 hypothetical protein [Streptomyces europaeiscabiei]MDX3555974.1 hypothetical protein [Streptomyces europaeiscabiei]